WMEFILTKDPTTAEMFARFGRHVWDLEGDETYAVDQAAIDATFDWIQHLGFPMTLPEVGIADEAHFDAMSTAAVANASLETRAYVPLSEEDVKSIYQASMTNGLTA
ncbi:iron-containing alcohol dehydrogenase, partial [Escherichia coli]|uniref:iron-containing alcohol dehydrogenase n=1 Tax=Escherichia coli TaxID=562 RepID=UPI0011CB7F52